ncbi:translocation/assembly module TamB [Paradesertivirga mongoliensis]|uniref:Translocation/assembly module TamB n=1 Tax=Paradesertivirga mongoliensis TaxID=2100740 RepID=A0ABW4ZG80_9SPHI|nr:translocation/assembly module TamB [Pedobacter mongoliensis]
MIFSLQFKPVQTVIAKRAAKYLSKELNTTVSIESLYIKPFKSIVLEGLYVQDLDKDTLLHSPKFTVDLNYFSLKERVVSVNTVQMDDGKFFLKTYKTGETNLQFIINYFDTGTPRPSTTPKRRYDVSIDKVVLNNIDFKYKNYNRNSVLKRINFDDLHLRNVNTTVLNVNSKTHLFQADVQNLNFREKSGFYLKNLSAKAAIDTNQMEFKGLVLQTPSSQVADYLLLKYKNFKDLNKFVSKVYLNARLKNTHIHSRDLAFFADNLPQNLEVKLKGNVSGYVTDIKARNFTASAGQATYVKGNFDIKGLGTNKGISLFSKVDRLYSNAKDADRLAKLFTGKSNLIPAVVAKFGNVSFGGEIITLIKQYRADGKLKTSLEKVDVNGQFKTALGRVNTDATLVMNGGPRYSGRIKAYDFNLGKLLDRKDLGYTTLSANVVGKGFSLGNIEENIIANVTYIDYNGYRYTNVDVKGRYNKNLFNGNIDINDRNLKLNFLGGINFASKLPTFNFDARLRNTNLHKLGFTKDTVQIDADFHTDFTGNNLNNIQGNLQLKKIRVTTPQHSMVVDSVYVLAKGVGNSRSLTINSDILDAGIKGQYDLNKLPNYFTSVIKQYIPSLKSKGGPRGVQNFDFTLSLKYFEPISVMFIPALKIPEGADFQGRFVSAENIATLTGTSSLIEYNNIKVNNLIIDESTTASALNVFVTSDRVDINDNLYIKNVNVLNVFRNDSLSLNVKLSDKDAVNQLDLNGLVEFDTETFARLSLLPSDVIINKEVWRILEQVQIDYNKGKLAIKNFALVRDNQYLTLDGIISNDPADKLNAGFKQFRLETFNPLMPVKKSSQEKRVTLGGELNGSIILSSVTKTPKLESDLVIDSLVMNDTYIGEMTMVANLDNRTRLVDMVVNIQKDGKETMNIAGNYDANTDKNTLNLDVVMDDSELVVFQPFIKHLVSNLSGKISSNLKITGNVFDPQINGTARLKDADLVINYLKTRYRINDDLRISNSIIDLGRLELMDIRNNTAQAVGTINLKNPLIPVVDIEIEAERPFMVLNTTSKDNALYYGTAYGTGTFTFKGPTNNMEIVIDAKTEEGTVFNIPLNAAERVSSNDMITFVAKDSTLAPAKAPTFSGLTMTLVLEVDEASVVNIITDLGKLSGRGNSQELRLEISSLGDFRMFGTYLIKSGKFQYTAQEYISKIFQISQGGSIRWTGDPVEADITLNAVYSNRANVGKLYEAAGYSGTEHNQSIVSEAVMTLSGNLLRPDIKFDINFPQDPYVKDELNSYLSEASNRTQQALSFIARGSFASNTGMKLDAVNETFVNVFTEVTFNRINDILAQALNLPSVDLNVRSLNDARATVSLFNDRVLLTGGITDTRDNVGGFDVIGNSFSRDAEAQFFIKKDANSSLIARASNRLNNRMMLNRNQEYVSSLGLVYTKDFDTLGEFLRALIGKGTKEEKEEEDKPQGPPPPVNTNPAIVIVPAPSEQNAQKKAANK